MELLNSHETNFIANMQPFVLNEVIALQKSPSHTSEYSDVKSISFQAAQYGIAVSDYLDFHPNGAVTSSGL